MQFRLVKQWRKAGTGGASAALQRITSTNTHTALPPPPARASLHLTGATETRTGSGGPRRGEDKAGTVKQRKSWSGAGISPESLTRIPRLKPPTAAPLSPAGRARRQGTPESRSQVVLCPARQDPSGGGSAVPSGRCGAWGTGVGARRGAPGKVGARKTAFRAECEARLPLPPAAPPPALSPWVSARL